MTTKAKPAPVTMTAAEMSARMSAIGAELASVTVHRDERALIAERDALRDAYRDALTAESDAETPPPDPETVQAVADLIERIDALTGPLITAIAEIEPHVRSMPSLATARMQRLILCRNLMDMR